MQLDKTLVSLSYVIMFRCEGSTEWHCRTSKRAEWQRFTDHVRQAWCKAKWTCQLLRDARLAEWLVV